MLGTRTSKAGKTSGLRPRDIIEANRELYEEQYMLLKKGRLDATRIHIAWVFPVARTARSFDDFVEAIEHIYEKIPKDTNLAKGLTVYSKHGAKIDAEEIPCKCGYTKVFRTEQVTSGSGSISHPLCPIGYLFNRFFRFNGRVKGALIGVGWYGRTGGEKNLYPDWVDGTFIIGRYSDVEAVKELPVYVIVELKRSLEDY